MIEHHQEFTALIPWYLNGTIDDRQRKHLDAHLSQCASCRSELQFERRVHEGMTGGTGVEYMPAASLKRLQAQLDALDTAGSDYGTLADSTATIPANVMRPHVIRSAFPWKSLLAASVATIALAVGLFLENGRMAAPIAPHSYHTVTSATPRGAGEVIRAVFSPTVTLVELQSILDETRLRIVSGPTEAGVYSLASDSDRPVATSLALLRQHPAVRFAESTEPVMAPADPR